VAESTHRAKPIPAFREVHGQKWSFMDIHGHFRPERPARRGRPVRGGPGRNAEGFDIDDFCAILEIVIEFSIARFPGPKMSMFSQE
jgi:hypothetical protein